ncbi:hypothetical protein D9C73_006850 [Collichthys lucidus]|uniref:Uncharacterized protein n=1 Tax=Collichthys lucidus TaxID=240159 RepID=A0A4U5UE40_COLLU|nr:hypothetical protein D9C73_006850 [Collichthys lucidus]
MVYSDVTLLVINFRTVCPGDSTRRLRDGCTVREDPLMGIGAFPPRQCAATGSGSAWKGSGAKVPHGSGRELYSTFLPGPRRFPGPWTRCALSTTVESQRNTTFTSSRNKNLACSPSTISRQSTLRASSTHSNHCFTSAIPFTLLSDPLLPLFSHITINPFSHQPLSEPAFWMQTCKERTGKDRGRDKCTCLSDLKTPF